MNTINKYLNKYSLLIFGIITLILIFIKEPFSDEIHAYDIACLKWSEIFYLTRIEGHPFLWYSVLKPFCSLNIFPYSMMFLNWAFCMGALYVLWKQAPFNTLIKAFITFSTPFLLYYAIVARCYAIGLFFLFLICAYYPKRFKKPYLFSSLILLCANSNLMALVACFYISLIYMWELFLRYKKNLLSKAKLLKTYSILFFCAFLLLIQFINLNSSTLGDSDYFINLLSLHLLPLSKNPITLIFRIFSAITFYFLFFYTFKKSKKAWFFGFFTFLTLTLIFYKINSGNFWNHFTYFIYLIVLFWIFYSIFKKNKFAKMLFAIIAFLSMFPYSLFEDGKMELVFSSNAKEIAKIIKTEPMLQNKKLYDITWWTDIHPGATRYLAKDGIKVYDRFNNDKLSFNSSKKIFEMQRNPIDFDAFMEKMDKNGYIISTHNLTVKHVFKNTLVEKKENGFVLTTQNKKYYLKEIYNKTLKKGNVTFNVYKVYEI